MFLEPRNQFALLLPGRVFALGFNGGVKQERCEEVRDPLPAAERAHAEKDEDPAKDHRAEDAPEERPVSVSFGHFQRLEDEQEDEEID